MLPFIWTFSVKISINSNLVQNFLPLTKVENYHILSTKYNNFENLIKNCLSLMKMGSDQYFVKKNSFMKCSLHYKQNLAILRQLSDQATNAETRQNKKKQLQLWLSYLQIPTHLCTLILLRIFQIDAKYIKPHIIPNGCLF